MTQRAFGRDTEADLIDRLRADGEVVASLIALEGGRVVGHILFSRLPIIRGDQEIAAVALGPMSVDPGHQGLGVGGLLVMRGLDTVHRRGKSAVVVLGHPGYYPRFGFRADLATDVETPYSGDALMALALDEGALDGGGRAVYPQAFAELG